jgi:hypothetical protein
MENGKLKMENFLRASQIIVIPNRSEGAALSVFAENRQPAAAGSPQKHSTVR